jgi:hypothetical protein
MLPFKPAATKNFVFEKDPETTIYVHLFLQHEEDEDRKVCETCGKPNDATMVRTKVDSEIKTYHCVSCIIELAEFLKAKFAEQDKADMSA